MGNKEWIPHKPDNIVVPVAEATPINKILFRFVTNPTPISDDFLPSCIDPRQKRMWSSRKSIPAFHGTSLFVSEDKALLKKKESPQAFQGVELAKGKVTNEHGLGIISKSGHVTLWFYKGIFPKGFKLL